MDKNSLKIMSYNSTGLARDKCDFIREILNIYSPDILFLQETWLLNSRLDLLASLNKGYLAGGVSAMTDEELIVGRPKGGVGILWKKSLVNLVQFHRIPGTTRACAVSIKCGTDKLLCINMYLPVDNQCKNSVDPEFERTLDAIDIFIEKCNIRNVILAGDMNVDFNRKNAHDVYFSEFIARKDICCTLNLLVSDSRYTYHDPANGSFSCIDHFSLSSGLCDSVMYVSRYDSPLNPSKHLPIILLIATETVPSEIKDDTNGNDALPIAWHRVKDTDIDQYMHMQNIILDQVITPAVFDCKDLSCSNKEHTEQIDIICNTLVQCCLEADKCFPRVKIKKSNKPYWREEVQPYKTNSIWWHNLWKQCGEPRQGIVYDSKTDAKRQYMYAVRRYNRKEDQLRKEKMAEAICENRNRDFYREMKKLKPGISTAPSIDGQIDSINIADKFADKYEELYNSVPPDQQHMDEISNQIQRQCLTCSEDDSTVKPSDIDKAIQHLKANKGDGDKGLMSNHLQYSSATFREWLSKLMTSILVHGYHPQAILLATVASIPKDNRGNICDSKNYRGITLCSSISKLFDIIMMIRYEDKLQTSEMQFAFKKKHSTTTCSLIVKEVVRYYLDNNSEVYSCCIDATKAFDRVRYDKLFALLIERNVPSVALRALLDMYTRQSVRTVWKSQYSRQFGTQNGIRQGGVISPVLFCVYMDVLLLKLEAEGDGCWIGNHFFGSIGYADDLKLLTPSIKGLRNMIASCEAFGVSYGVQYNPVKTECIMYTRKPNPEKPTIQLCGTELKWKENVKHLGNWLSSDLSEKTDVIKKRGDLVQRVNNMMANIGGGPDTILKKVFNTQCAHLYGVSAWNFNDKSIQMFVTMWNRCVRNILQLPPATHTRFLPLIMDKACVLDQIFSRFLKMYLSMEKSDNKRMCYLSKIGRHSARSIIGGNLRVISKRLQLDTANVISQGVRRLRSAYLRDCTDEDHAALSLINDLRSCIKQQMTVLGFSVDELTIMYEAICTD